MLSLKSFRIDLREISMKPLIDCDVLRYEIGFSAEYVDEEGEQKVREWEFVEELFDNKVELICDSVGATEAPLLFLTNDSRTDRIWRRWGKTVNQEIPDRKDNFRLAVAKTKPYKGTRKEAKPVHYDNLTAYVISKYNTEIGNGLEADDLMAIYQTANKNTIICSRDKDLKQVPGLHYSWECGRQPEIGPIEFDKKGEVLVTDGKVSGGGELFFLSQMLTGDTVDNIPGLPKFGPQKVLKVLDNSMSRKEAYNAIREAYRGVYGDEHMVHLEEQAALLWLIRELRNGEPVFWEWPYEK